MAITERGTVIFNGIDEFGYRQINSIMQDGRIVLMRVFRKTLSQSIIGTPHLVRKATFFRFLEAIGIGMSKLERQATFLRILFATVLGLPQLVKQSSFARFLQVTAKAWSRVRARPVVELVRVKRKLMRFVSRLWER